MEVLEVGKVYSGAEFNRLYPHPCVKLTNPSETHNGYVYADGLNLLGRRQFSPHGSCSTGGLYFCDQRSIPAWILYGNTMTLYYRAVSIPNDARVYVEHDKFKTDALVLGERHVHYRGPHVERFFNKLLIYLTGLDHSDAKTWFNSVPDDMWDVLLSDIKFVKAMLPYFGAAPDRCFTRALLAMLCSDEMSFASFTRFNVDFAGVLLSRFPASDEHGPLVTPEICEALTSKGLPVCLVPDDMQSAQMWMRAAAGLYVCMMHYERMPARLQTREVLEVFLRCCALCAVSFPLDLYRPEDADYFKNSAPHLWPLALQTSDVWIKNFNLAELSRVDPSIATQVLDARMVNVICDHAAVNVVHLAGLKYIPADVLQACSDRIMRTLESTDFSGYVFSQLPAAFQTLPLLEKMWKRGDFSFMCNMSVEHCERMVQLYPKHLPVVPQCRMTETMVLTALRGCNDASVMGCVPKHLRTDAVNALLEKMARRSHASSAAANKIGIAKPAKKIVRRRKRVVR